MNWTSELRQRALMLEAQRLLEAEGLLRLHVDTHVTATINLLV